MNRADIEKAAYAEPSLFNLLAGPRLLDLRCICEACGKRQRVAIATLLDQALGIKVCDLRAPCPSCGALSVRYIPAWGPTDFFGKSKTADIAVTIAHARGHGLRAVRAHCLWCKHHKLVTFDVLEDAYGFGPDTSLAALAGNVYCEQCGHMDIEIEQAWDTAHDLHANGPDHPSFKGFVTPVPDRNGHVPPAKSDRHPFETYGMLTERTAPKT